MAASRTVLESIHCYGPIELYLAGTCLDDGDICDITAHAVVLLDSSFVVSFESLEHFLGGACLRFVDCSFA